MNGVRTPQVHRYRRRRARGECVRCGKDALGMAHCETCRADLVIRVQKSQAKKKKIQGASK